MFTITSVGSFYVFEQMNLIETYIVNPEEVYKILK